jgi:beta-lactamase class A
MPTASSIKLPILVEVFRQADEGVIRFKDRIRVRKRDHAQGSGVLQELDTVSLSIKDLATLMIVVSDNTATNLLIDLVGLESVNQTMAGLGFPATRLNGPIDFNAIGTDARRLAVSTSRDLAGLLECVATRSILTPASCESILDMLSRQQHLGLLPRYLPHDPDASLFQQPDNGLTILNKPGGWYGMRADVGLIQWPSASYVIAVMIDRDTDTRFWPENAGERLVGRLSRLVYERFGGR